MHQVTADMQSRTSPVWKQPVVLLIDHDEKRQFERAASMRRCGLTVDCAHDGASAVALWLPEKYRLVLIELSGAETAVRDFCERLQESSPLQQVGIYSSTAPYITRAGAEPASTPQPRAPRKSLQETGPSPRKISGTSSLVEAAQQIAAARIRYAGYDARPRPRPAHAPKPEAAPKPESDFGIAARVLGGEIGEAK